MLTAAEYTMYLPRSPSLPKRPPNAVRARLVVLIKKIVEGASLFSTEFDVEFPDSNMAVAEDLFNARLIQFLLLLDESEQVFGALRLHDVFDACVRDGLYQC